MSSWWQSGWGGGWSWWQAQDNAATSSTWSWSSAPYGEPIYYSGNDDAADRSRTPPPSKGQGKQQPNRQAPSDKPKPKRTPNKPNRTTPEERKKPVKLDDPSNELVYQANLPFNLPMLPPDTYITWRHQCADMGAQLTLRTSKKNVSRLTLFGPGAFDAYKFLLEEMLRLLPQVTPAQWKQCKPPMFSKGTDDDQQEAFAQEMAQRIKLITSDDKQTDEPLTTPKTDQTMHPQGEAAETGEGSVDIEKTDDGPPWEDDDFFAQTEKVPLL